MAEKRQNKWLLQDSSSIALQQFQNKMNFQRKGFNIALRFLPNIIKAQQCCLFIKEHFLPLRRCSESFWHHCRTIEVRSLKQPLILLFLFHKSATTCQIYLCKVSNPTLKLDICNCVKTEVFP